MATAKWLNSEPSSPLLDPAVATFANLIKEKDPEGAVEWAESITDPELRRKVMDNALNTLLQNDPEKAKLWSKKRVP